MNQIKTHEILDRLRKLELKYSSALRDMTRIKEAMENEVKN